MPTVAGRARPIEKFAEAVAKCGPEVGRDNLLSETDTDYGQATNYGKCIVADYQAVYQDMCKKEFMLLKDCYLVSDIG